MNQAAKNIFKLDTVPDYVGLAAESFVAAVVMGYSPSVAALPAVLSFFASTGMKVFVNNSGALVHGVKA